VRNSDFKGKYHRHHHRNRTTATTPSSLLETEIEEKTYNLMPVRNSEMERKHHRNRTTTTTTTSSTPLLEMESDMQE